MGVAGRVHGRCSELLSGISPVEEVTLEGSTQTRDDVGKQKPGRCSMKLSLPVRTR